MEGGIHENLIKVGGGEEHRWIVIWNESKKMWIIAGPAILVPFSTFGIIVISQAFIGQIDSTELAAYALVYSVIFRFVLGLQFGIVCGVGTLCGQAYGAKQYHKVGIYLQQSCIISLVATALTTPLFIFSSPILKALGQDEGIADMTGKYAVWFIAIILLYAVLYSCNTFLQSQSKNLVVSIYAVFSLIAHVLLSWLLSVKLEFGVTGVMAATVLAFLIPTVGQIVYITRGGCGETWRCFTALAFVDLGPTTKLAMSSAVMVCNILIPLAGNMGNAEVTIDALSICLNISGWAIMISVGFMAAAGVGVSNELGRRDTKAAKLAILMAVGTSFSIGLVVCVFVMVFRESTAYFFTKSEEVAEAVARFSPFLACTLLLNSVQPVLSGFANGTGQQGIVAYVNLVSYYLVGLPSAVLLGYVLHLQVEGLWLGIIIGTAVQTAILVVMTCRADWDKQIKLAQKRIRPTYVEEETAHNSS